MREKYCLLSENAIEYDVNMMIRNHETETKEEQKL